MRIALERPEDQTAIHALTEAAFQGVPYSDQTEAKIVDALRAAGALTLSLVARQDGEVIGHAAFSPVTIEGAAGGWQGLGPVCVRLDRRRAGVAHALIRDGLNRLKAMGAAGCVVLGDPHYYRRFGFQSDPALYYGAVPPGYFQGLSFDASSPKGEVRYHPGFEVA